MRPNGAELDAIADALPPLTTPPLTDADLAAIRAEARPRRRTVISAQGDAVRAESHGRHSIVSAQPRDEVWAERNLVFRSARDVDQETPETVPWVAERWVAEGAITEVVGKIKAAGKTTWITHLVRGVLSGTPHMGRPVAQSPVVYLTEQTPTTFREALRRAGLLDRDDLHVLFWRDTVGAPWQAVVQAAIAECRRRGAKLLVVDTLGQFAGLKGEGENSAGDALAAVQPLQEAAASGLGVVIVRHERKSGGEVGDSGRGSSAFAGAVDIVLAIRRAEGNSRPTLRVIHGLSRFDETPDTLVVELRQEGYVALGDETAIALHDARTAIGEHLPTDPGRAISQDELRELAKGTPRTTLQRALVQLLEERTVRRVGAGKRGDPYRYFLSARTPSL